MTFYKEYHVDFLYLFLKFPDTKIVYIKKKVIVMVNEISCEHILPENILFCHRLYIKLKKIDV